MRTFQQFREATEKDLKAMGANPDQINKLKQRASARGEKGFGTSGSTGSHFHQKQDKGGALAKRPSSALATKAADKGAAIVRKKNYKEPMASRPDEKQAGKRPGSTRTNPKMQAVMNKGVAQDRNALKTAGGADRQGCG